MDALQVVALISLILTSGGVASIIVQWIKGAGWSSRAKYALSIGISIAVGSATVWLTGDVLDLFSTWPHMDAAAVLAVLGMVYASSTGFYELWFKHSGGK